MKKLKNFIKTETKEIFSILDLIKKRDLKGNTGLALKNSTFHLATSLTAKIGSLIFTIIIARLLLPELFGLYSLALATILLFATISNLGSDQVFIKLISKELGKERTKKAKMIGVYFYKIKLFLVSVSVIFIFFFSRFIAENYYQKPIFLALLAGSLYIIFTDLTKFIDWALFSKNNFKLVFYKEIFFQIIRLIFIPLIILYTLSFSSEFIIMSIILGLSFCFFFTFLFYSIITKKEISYLRIKTTDKLSSKERRTINNLIRTLAVTTLSLMFFSYIDMLFLGRFVPSENIGFYKAAFLLIGSAAPIITFAGALFPIFSRLKGKRAEKALKKSIKLTLIISIPTTILSFLIAPFLINFIYGAAFSPAILIFRILALLLIFSPIIAIYSNFYISQNKPTRVTKAVLSAIIINLVLNLGFILYLLSRNASAQVIVIGVTIATLISKTVYLGMLLKNNSQTF